MHRADWSPCEFAIVLQENWEKEKAAENLVVATHLLQHGFIMEVDDLSWGWFPGHVQGNGPNNVRGIHSEASVDGFRLPQGSKETLNNADCMWGMSCEVHVSATAQLSVRHMAQCSCTAFCEAHGTVQLHSFLWGTCHSAVVVRHVSTSARLSKSRFSASYKQWKLMAACSALLRIGPTGFTCEVFAVAWCSHRRGWNDNGTLTLLQCIYWPIKNRYRQASSNSENVWENY